MDELQQPVDTTLIGNNPQDADDADELPVPTPTLEPDTAEAEPVGSAPPADDTDQELSSPTEMPPGYVASPTSVHPLGSVTPPQAQDPTLARSEAYIEHAKTTSPGFFDDELKLSGFYCLNSMLETWKARPCMGHSTGYPIWELPTTPVLNCYEPPPTQARLQKDLQFYTDEAVEKGYVSLRIYLWEWTASWRRKQHHVRQMAVRTRGEPDLNGVEPTAACPEGHAFNTREEPLPKRPKLDSSKNTPAVYDAETDAYTWMDPEDEAKRVANLITMEARPDALDTRMGAAENQRLKLMVQSAQSYKNLLLRGSCPNIGHYDSAEMPGDQPLYINSDPLEDLQYGFQLNCTILMSQQMLRAEMIRKGYCKANILDLMKNLYDMILLYAVIDSEKPEMSARPQRLLWIKERFATAAWHRIRMDGLIEPLNVAVHPPMLLQEALDEQARNAKATDDFHRNRAACFEPQGPNLEQRARKDPQGPSCELCGQTNEAGAIFCPTCDRLLVCGGGSVTTLDTYGNQLQVKINDMLERMCNFKKIDRQALTFRVPGQDMPMRGQHTDSSSWYRKIKA